MNTTNDLLARVASMLRAQNQLCEVAILGQETLSLSVRDVVPTLRIQTALTELGIQYLGDLARLPEPPERLSRVFKNELGLVLASRRLYFGMTLEGWNRPTEGE